MGLCKFFQQGSCRFGSKCVNEHLDVKQMIKTDVEAAINGKQWPLSTYGPFRDKPSIPNFIEDQSFEEVRMLCYEAKRKNFFEQFHQQFNKEALEANNKMSALLQMTVDIIDVLINVYDVPQDTSGNGVSVGKTSNSTSNPFGLANSTSSSCGSIFAKPTTNSSANNVFANASNAFATTNQSTSGLFTNTSVFTPQQQQQSSIFAQATQPVNSIFYVGSNNNTQQNASILSMQQNQTNIFPSSIQQQQPTQTTTGLFSQNQFLQQPPQNSNFFRQATQVSQPQQGLFAQAAQTIQTQPGIFSQAIQKTAPSQGLFAQAAQQTQNMFGQVLQPQQQTSSNIFQQNLPNSGTQQQHTSANIFQQNQSITGQQQNQQPPGIFQQTTFQNPAGQANDLTQVSLTLYSRLEDLTNDEIEAFKADCFLPGKIPFNPPPKELIN